ncbi:MAG: imidazoleglycerol-phosphate dehydratase HisB [Campylobacteraceae bacterium]|nr:imidazoleglycerol-phosphate dehydratase HisB [Campylobacteraceae bacterium]
MIKIERNTKETQIALELELSGSGSFNGSSKIGFFDHMLNTLAKHSGMDINLDCNGDLHVDFHHTVEDVGIVLGEAIHKVVFPVGAIERFGEAKIVMDEALIESAIDISGRPYLYFDLGKLSGKVGEFDAELCEEFFRALIFNSKISAHITKARGHNLHHIVEGAFKAFAVSLKRALRASEKSGIPSTKGVL